jgi:triosephosphate isomerase
MPQKIVAANWKMNMGLDSGKVLSSEVLEMVATEGSTDVTTIICPPFIHLSVLAHLIKDKPVIFLGAQNCHQEPSGAFTGEISAEMLRSCHVDYVILGHSERREYFNETDEVILQKMHQVLNNGMKVIYCCGEKLNSRESGQQFDIVQDQISKSVLKLDPGVMGDVVIAYEPVWAIGTGKTATADQAQEMHAYIRGSIQQQFGPEIANQISILYGGSVKPDNAQEIFEQPDVNGGLIGGASLKSRDFTDIVKAAGR